MGCCGGGHHGGNHGRSESGHGYGTRHQETNAYQTERVHGNQSGSGQMAEHGNGKRKSNIWSLFSFAKPSNHH
ncbi:hypothetical protein LSG31_08975 [Fodinisporobacter ferrooxydans]|uniref:Uncharacterized protein n=1 Tax=Fodinisporobacter ferrooxydans TaxID=2901836 RepID=A0ABY4CPF2_9BACL|nr:hypothetical protein LSG31_08975 [Alicyclobacillaceae bacterium MYW30-H2]